MLEKLLVDNIVYVRYHLNTNDITTNGYAFRIVTTCLRGMKVRKYEQFRK